MEISQLRYFVEISKCGSMAVAAENMHITQQGISMALRRLESELGKNLFYQKSKRLHLTSFGEDFLVEAENVVEHMDKLQELINTNECGKPCVNVAVVITRLTKLPSQLQRLFLTPPDDYNINILEGFSSECAEMILQETADLALVFGHYDSSLFDETVLETIQRVFIVNRENPLAQKDTISFKELDNVPLVITDQKTQPGVTVAKMFEDAGCSLKIAYRCNWQHQPIELVSSNPSLIAATCLCDINDQDLMKIKPLYLENHEFTVDFCLISKKGKRLEVHEQLLKRIIMECYTETAEN